MLKQWFNDESGQTITEYGLLIGLLAVVVVTILVAMRGDIARMFGTIETEIDTAADAVSGAD